MTTLGDNLRMLRERCGLQQGQLGHLLGHHDGRQIRAWERGPTKPNADNMGLLATILDATVDQLMGRAPLYDLTGTWYAAWQTTRGGVPTIDRHELVARYEGTRVVHLYATGSYRWLASPCALTGDHLGGHFVSSEADYDTEGEIHFWIHPDADRAVGDWIGHYADGRGGHGRGALARDRQTADELLDWLIANPAPYTEFPEI